MIHHQHFAETNPLPILASIRSPLNIQHLSIQQRTHDAFLVCMFQKTTETLPSETVASFKHLQTMSHKPTMVKHGKINKSTGASPRRGERLMPPSAWTVTVPVADVLSILTVGIGKDGKMMQHDHGRPCKPGEIPWVTFAKPIEALVFGFCRETYRIRPDLWIFNLGQVHLTGDVPSSKVATGMG